MKILLTSIGTRGDIEPFLALGEILNKRGHEIIYSFPEQLSTLIPEHQRSYPLSRTFIELIESEEGKTIMGKASLWKKLKALIHLYKEGKRINKKLILQQYEAAKAENPDVIIHNAKCSYPPLWALKNQKPAILVSPVPFFMHYVKGHAHIGFNKNFGKVLNKLTYSLSNFGLTRSVYEGQQWLPENFQYEKSAVKKGLLNQKIVFAISPALFPRPAYWPENAQVLGFHERTQLNHWQPNKDLQDFLLRYEKVIFLTFGSMVNSHPEQISKILYQSLKDLNIPTIVNIASGGLVRLPEFADDETFHFVQSVPYEWIFPKVYAVIHHGGSGTTQSALKHGCASLILPHVLDQYGWNNLISETGAGPKGISVNKLSITFLKKAIHLLYHHEAYKKRAEELSLLMLNEEMEADLVNFIGEKL